MCENGIERSVSHDNHFLSLYKPRDAVFLFHPHVRVYILMFLTDDEVACSGLTCGLWFVACVFCFQIKMYMWFGYKSSEYDQEMHTSKLICQKNKRNSPYDACITSLYHY